jgi:hypothetical protein
VTLADIIACADANATRVWTLAGGPAAFFWHEGLTLGPGPLAQWAAGDPGRPAPLLYAIATAQTDAVPWEETPPALRCALEVFRATVVVLMAERAHIRAPSGAHTAPGALAPTPQPSNVRALRPAGSVQ